MTGYGVPGYDVRVTLPEICRENGTYKYELYSNGKVIDSGSVEKIADPFYKSRELHFDLKDDGDYLFVFYDKDSDEDVLAYGWFHYAEAEYADMMPEG